MPERDENPPATNEELLDRWFDAMKNTQLAWRSYLQREVSSNGFTIPDPMVVGRAFLEWWQRAAANPVPLFEMQEAAWRDYAALWMSAFSGQSGEDAPPVATPAKDDRRFNDKAWEKDAWYNLLKQSYLITSNWIMDSVARIEGLEPQTEKKVLFYARQLVDAISPSNFVATNPQVLRATIESGGENLIKGMEHFAADIERGRGRLDIAQTDYERFRLGENIAATPGKVVYQNELMQLIQYDPATDTVYRRPLLIVPPWINKYYVLDLQPKNSFIKWAVDQGHTVFIVSWVNPGSSLRDKSFEDYMLDGPLAAIAAIERATGEAEVNIVGYCIGGTLTAATLANLDATGDTRIKSATFLTSLVDFSEPGELGVFIDEQQLTNLERHMEEKGYLEGHHMGTVFNLLRDRDLIWSFVVNNYLLGREPFAFDLLYWNADSTRMPASMHKFYLRNMYQHNRLIEPNRIEMAGVPIDLRRVKVPAYLLSTEQDHIAPWESTYAATQIFAGPVRFVLSASGHIAGVINPPAAHKYAYWTNTRKPKSPTAWRKNASQHEGSWWLDWQRWVSRHGGGRAAARVPGSGDLAPLEDAPGTYVKVRVIE